MTRPMLTLADLDPVFRHADFDPSKVIVFLRLVELNERDWRLMSMPDALDYITEIGARLSADPSLVSGWREKIAHAVVGGRTACVTLYACGANAYIAVDSLCVRPVAKA